MKRRVGLQIDCVTLGQLSDGVCVYVLMPLGLSSNEPVSHNEAMV